MIDSTFTMSLDDGELLPSKLVTKLMKDLMKLTPSVVEDYRKDIVVYHIGSNSRRSSRQIKKLIKRGIIKPTIYKGCIPLSISEINGNEKCLQMDLTVEYQGVMKED